MLHASTTFLFKSPYITNDLRISPSVKVPIILLLSSFTKSISRLTFQLDNANLTHEQLKSTIRIIAEKVLPIVNSG